MRLSPLTRPAFSVPGIFGLSLVSVLAIACGSSPKDAAVVADAGAAPIPVSSTHPGPTGSTCSSITETFSLCADLSLCPGVTIDSNLFPDCGYSVHDDAIDPECLCYGSVCPMGAPVTCADMATILANTTTADACAKVQAGHCLDLGGPGGPTNCEVCQHDCDGDPACLSGCGC